MVLATIFNLYLLIYHTPPDKDNVLEKINSCESLNKTSSHAILNQAK